MAVSNKISMSTLGGVGSSSGTKKKSAVSTSYSDNLLGGGVSNPQVSLPQNLSYKDNLVNLQPVGGVGAGTGGVTNEGVILGNPNVERMPTINRNGSSAHQFKTFGQLVDETGKDLTSYAANGISEGTTIQESVLRRGTPEFEAATNPLNIEGQNLGAATRAGTMTTYAANGIGTEDTGATGGATGSTGSTGGSTTGSGEVDTYEEFLLKQEGLYKQQYEDLLAQIEAERQRGVIDARSSYEQNKATYGANAEQLAAMGLSGSGYSDYLNQQAYATQRAETQGANAQAESNKLQAGLAYSENLMNLEREKMQYNEQQQAEKEATFDTLYDAAISGAYSSEQLKTIGEGKGFNEEEIKTLTDAANKYRATYLNEFYRTESNNILSQGSDYNTTYLENALSNGDIDQETYDKLMKDYASVVIEESDSETLENLYKEGKIDDITYQTKIDEWNKDIDTSTAFFNGADYTAGKQAYEEVINNPWATEETKAQLKASYLRTYAEDIARELVGDSVSGGVVDINSGSYNAKQWGDYNDIGDPDSGQGRLISRFIADAKAGKIKEGQVITVNYGQVWSDYGVYVYVGDGVFVKCKNSARNDYEKYTPSGYKYGGINGSIRK